MTDSYCLLQVQRDEHEEIDLMNLFWKIKTEKQTCKVSQM